MLAMRTYLMFLDKVPNLIEQKQRQLEFALALDARRLKATFVLAGEAFVYSIAAGLAAALQHLLVKCRNLE
jgi:hypothetical protein